MSIKDVVYRVVHAYPGGVPALAARMGISKHVLQNKVNPNNDTHHLTINELMQIQEFTNSDEIAKHIAAERNMICIRLAEFEGVSDMELLDLFMKLETRKVAWMASVQKALSDGVVDPKEFERISSEFNEFSAAGAEVENRLKSMVQDRPFAFAGKFSGMSGGAHV